MDLERLQKLLSIVSPKKVEISEVGVTLYFTDKVIGIDYESSSGDFGDYTYLKIEEYDKDGYSIKEKRAN